MLPCVCVCVSMYVGGGGGIAPTPVVFSLLPILFIHTHTYIFLCPFFSLRNKSTRLGKWSIDTLQNLLYFYFYPLLTIVYKTVLLLLLLPLLLLLAGNVESRLITSLAFPSGSVPLPAQRAYLVATCALKASIPHRLSRSCLFCLVRSRFSLYCTYVTRRTKEK